MKMIKLYGSLLAGVVMLSGCSAQATTQVATQTVSQTISQTDVIDLSKGSVHITQSGVYTLSGELKEGVVVVDIDTELDKGLVTLILNNAHLYNEATAPIQILSAKEVSLLISDGTENTVFQGALAVKTL